MTSSSPPNDRHEVAAATALYELHADAHKKGNEFVGITIQQASELLAERELLREALIECVRLSGADMSDGVPTWPPLHRWAVDEVRQLRTDYDEAINDPA